MRVLLFHLCFSLSVFYHLFIVFKLLIYLNALGVSLHSVSFTFLLRIVLFNKGLLRVKKK